MKTEQRHELLHQYINLVYYGIILTRSLSALTIFQQVNKEEVS